MFRLYILFTYSLIQDEQKSDTHLFEASQVTHQHFTGYNQNIIQRFMMTFDPSGRSYQRHYYR